MTNFSRKPGTLNISISREHAKYASEIEKCFKEVDTSVHASYIRLSEGELPMQVLIFIGGAVISGAFWDVLKIGIKKIFLKFKKVQIEVHDNQSVPFVVFPDGRVKAIIIPEREKEFSHIKKIDDLIVHLANTISATPKQIHIKEGWRMVKLGDVVEIQNGFAFKSKDFLNKGIPVIKIKNIASGKLNMTDVQYYNGSIDNLQQYFLEDGDILVSMTGSHISQLSSAVGKVAKYDLDRRALLNQRVGKIIPDKSLIDHEYLYYLVSQPEVQNFWGNRAGGSANQANISPSTIKSFSFELPPLLAQRQIAHILSTFDKKIELLKKQNKTLENIAQTLFKRWFVNFEFPNEEGKPYKSRGGRMFESEMGEIPEGWRVGRLGDAIELFDSKRIPLSSEKRSLIKGIYPYYGATEIMDYIYDYIFDGIYILLAEDGSVIDTNGFPILQYVWGKFWVNNHTHILQGKNGWSSEILLLLFKRTKVAGIISGAVQLKINQQNLCNLQILIPHKETLDNFNRIIQPIFYKIRCNSSQIQILSIFRDKLLQKLMDGKVKLNF